MRICSLLSIVGVACSNPSPATLDATARDAPSGDPDATPDANPDSAPSQVTVRLIGRVSGPVTGTALFYSPSGALVARVAADSAGLASATVPAGGSVTVVETGTSPGFGGPPYFTTFMEVEPGDELRIGDLGSRITPFESASLVVPPGPAAANEYRITSDCGESFFGTTSPIPFTLYAGCPAGPLPIILTALQPGTMNLTGYIYDSEVPVVAGGTPTIDGNWQPPVTVTTAITGLPAPAIAGIRIGRFAHGLGLYSSAFGGTSQSTGSLNTSGVQPGGGEGLMTELTVIPSGAGGQYKILEYLDGTPNDITGSAAGDFVPLPRDPFPLEGSSGVTGIAWTMSGGAGFDGVVLRLSMRGPSDGAATWTIVAPPPMTLTPVVTMPPLPADFAALWAQYQHAGSSVIVADTPATSYAEFRRDAEPRAFTHHWMFRPTTPSKIRLGLAAWIED